MKFRSAITLLASAVGAAAESPDASKGEFRWKSTEEIAISILGEMQAVPSHRNGGALRDRTAPIHDPVDQSPITA